MFIYMYILLQ